MPAAPKIQPVARVSSGFQRVWDDLGGETLSLAPGSTIAPAPAPPDTDRRNQMAALPKLPVAAPDRTTAPDLQLGPALGQGGMGLVQLARQQSLARDVAVKTVRPDVADAATAAAELVREARITGQLDHPNIVPVHALGQTDDGRPMLVMKRVAGTPWKQLLASDPPDFATRQQSDALERHLRVLMQVCNAVHFAHSKGIVHRDLKPENVMVGGFGEVYVLDWGVAVQQGDPVPAGIAGTPAFMAPEMLAPGPGSVTPQTDVYLLGGLLHALLTGRPRHEGDDLYAVLYAAWQSAPVAYEANVPAELAALANRATAKLPTDRPLTALELRLGIEEFLRHRESLRLEHEARARLADLQTVVAGVLADDMEAVDEETGALVQQLGAEARFGFQQALGAWDGNAQARDGEQAVVVALARFAIAEGDARTAGHLVASLDAPPQGLVDALHALESAKVASQAAQARLQRIERELDFDTGSDVRSQFALAAGVVWAVLPAAFGILQRLDLYEPTHAGFLFSGLFFAGFLGAGIWLGRADLLANRINRAFVRSLVVGAAATLLVRAVVWLQGVPVAHALAYDMVVLFLLFGAMAAMIDKRLALVTGVYGAAALVASVHAESALFVTGGANLVGMTGVALVWSPRSRCESKRTRLVRHLQEVRACMGEAAWAGLKAATGRVH